MCLCLYKYGVHSPWPPTACLINFSSSSSPLSVKTFLCFTAAHWVTPLWSSRASWSYFYWHFSCWIIIVFIHISLPILTVKALKGRTVSYLPSWLPAQRGHTICWMRERLMKIQFWTINQITVCKSDGNHLCRVAEMSFQNFQDIRCFPQLHF